MREKLIELLTQVAVLGDYLDMRKVADHLIANGATIPVRCQDCKHWKNEINGCTEDKRFCDIGFYMVHKNGFCSFGERKTNEFER